MPNYCIPVFKLGNRATVEMKLIFNISNLNGAGVVQVAQSFLEECREDSIREYHIFISKRILVNFQLDSLSW